MKAIICTVFIFLAQTSMGATPPDHLQFAYGVAKSAILSDGKCGHYLSVTITKQPFQLVNGLGSWSDEKTDRGLAAKFEVSVDTQLAGEYEAFRIRTRILRSDGTQAGEQSQIFPPNRQYEHPDFEMWTSLNMAACADEAYFLAIPENLPREVLTARLMEQFNGIEVHFN